MALFPTPHFPTSHSHLQYIRENIPVIFDDNDKDVRNTSWDNIPAVAWGQDTRVLGDNTAPVDRNGDNVLARRPAE